MDLRYYFRILLRRLHWLVLFVLIGTSAGLWMALTLPSVFEAQARLIVESEQIPDELAASTVRTAATEQIEIIEQRILTRERLLEMSNSLNIYEGQGQIPAGEKVEDLRNRIDISVQGGRNRSQATLVFVQFRSDNPQLAANVTNELVTLILRENVAMRTSVSGQTLDFFIQEVDRLGQEMSRLGGRILAFKEENIESLPDSLDFRRSRQAATQQQIQEIARDMSALEERRAQLIDLFESTGDLPEETGPLTEEERQLGALRREYANAIAILSPENPKVAVLQARIGALEETVAQQRAGRSDAESRDEDDATTRQPPSPLEIQLADIDGQLDALSRRAAEAEERMTELSKSIQATPGISVALQAMERDYQNLQIQYNQAVANKARAETGDLIEALSKGQRIAVIEQAVVPKDPVSPNRPLILASGMGSGLALGIAIFVLLELLNGAVRRPSEITTKLGISPLATVPYIRTRRQIRNRRLAVGAATAGVLVVLTAGGWLVQNDYQPLEGTIERIREQVETARARL